MATERNGKLRFGVCGTAHWAETVHLPALGRNGATRLVGVWGRRPQRVAELADTFGIRGYADFDAMLADVDAVAFALPPQVQGDMALRAARAGKALVLEKPLATDPAAATALLREIERRGVRAACVLSRRHIPALAAFVAAATACGATNGAATLHSSPLVPGSPYAASAWRQAGDGGLWDLGPHALTTLMAIFGPVDRVDAERRGDAFLARLSHRSGATSLMDLSIRAAADAACDRCEVDGAFGRLRVERGDYDRLAAYDGVLAEITDDERWNAAPWGSVRAAERMVAILAAALASAETGRPVAVAA